MSRMQKLFGLFRSVFFFFLTLLSRFSLPGHTTTNLMAVRTVCDSNEPHGKIAEKLYYARNETESTRVRHFGSVGRYGKCPEND